MSTVHILLVEDTITQALFMQHLLESEEFKVSVAKDGVKALQFLSSERPDLVLSDVSMPEMDGYELCRTLKADASMRAIPVVLLSSFHDPSDIVKIINCQADSFLLKRFDKDYIVGGLKDVLQACSKKASTENAAEEKRQAIAVTVQSNEHVVKANAEQLATMLAASFRTSVYLLPLVSQE
jgi:two-component system, sensor histidine kinase and response regulator